MVPFDAVLVIAFGGPLGLADVRPFLANVLRGRRVTPERVDEVAHHYELFGGVSPLPALTRAQADGLANELRNRGRALPVYVGMRNWHPYLSETLADMSHDGVRRAIGFIAAPHRSYSSCTQYRENVRAARAAIRQEGLRDVEVIYNDDWFNHPGFIEAAADHAVSALKELRSGLADAAMLVFTAHSIPVSMAERYPYREQYGESARLVAERVRERTGLALPYATVYQSRSGRPEDPWLGPDVCEFLRTKRRTGLEAAVLCPIGFISDHMEVVYDLDTEATVVCRDIGLTMVRARTANDHPAFINMMADVVLATDRRYAHARPLQIVAQPVRDAGA